MSSGHSETPSVANASSARRTKRSLVWGYSSYDTDSNKSGCQFRLADLFVGKKITEKNPTNLKQHTSHLSTFHEHSEWENAQDKCNLQALPVNLG